MANTRYFVTGEQYDSIKAQMGEILRQLEGPNGSSLGPAQLSETLQGVIEKKQPAIVEPAGLPVPIMHHGMFTWLHRKVENIRRWNKKYKWGFSDDELEAANRDSAQFDVETGSQSRNKLVVKTLVPYLDTPFRTFTELMKVMRDEHWVSHAESNFCDLKEDRFRISGAPHQSGLRWEMIDLGGGHDWKGGAEHAYKQFNLPPLEKRPNAGIFAEIAHSPFWARRLDSYHGTPGVAATGYEVQRIYADGKWGNPYLITPYPEGWWRTNSLSDSHRQGWHMEAAVFESEESIQISSPILLAHRPVQA